MREELRPEISWALEDELAHTAPEARDRLIRILNRVLAVMAQAVGEKKARKLLWELETAQGEVLSADVERAFLVAAEWTANPEALFLASKGPGPDWQPGPNTGHMAAGHTVKKSLKAWRLKIATSRKAEP